MTLLAWWNFNNADDDSDLLNLGGLDNGRASPGHLLNSDSEGDGFLDADQTIGAVVPQEPGGFQLYPYFANNVFFPGALTNFDATGNAIGVIPSVDGFSAVLQIAGPDGFVGDNYASGTTDNWGAGVGTNFNIPASASQTSGSALEVTGTGNNGRSFDILADFTNHEDIEISFTVSTEVATGFDILTIAASSDNGATFQTVRTFTALDNFGAANPSETLASLAGEEDAVIRITIDGAEQATSTARFDNIQLNGTPINGSPFGGIVFNEVLADFSLGEGAFDTNGDGFMNVFDTFVELVNTTGNTVDASGWQFWTGARDLVFVVHEGTEIAPGGFLTLVTDDQSDGGGGSLPTVAPGSAIFEDRFATGNMFDSLGGDNIVLYDPATDTYVQATVNGDALEDPTGPTRFSGFSPDATVGGPDVNFGTSPTGASRALSPDGDASSIFEHNALPSGANASPGSSNSSFRLESLVFNEILVNPNTSFTPPLGFDTDGDGETRPRDEFVEFRNTSDAPINVAGLELWTRDDKLFEVPATSGGAPSVLAPGGLLYLINDTDLPLPQLPEGSLAFSMDIPPLTPGSSVGANKFIDNGNGTIVLLDRDANTFIAANTNGTNVLSQVGPGNDFPTTATLAKPVQFFGFTVDGVSKAIAPDGSIVNHDEIGDLQTLASPGLPNISSDPLLTLVINEIGAFPQVGNAPGQGGGAGYDTNGDGVTDAEDKFLELYNPGDAALDVSGLEFWDRTGGNWFTIPDLTFLAPESFLLLARAEDGSLPKVAPGSLVFDTSPGAEIGSSYLNNGIDNVVIYDPDTGRYIQAIYGDLATIDVPESDSAYTVRGFDTHAALQVPVLDFGPLIQGTSNALSPDGATNNPVRHDDIGSGTAAATPGASNVAVAPGIENLVINEIMNDPVNFSGTRFFDTDGDGVEEAEDQYIELYNDGSAPIDLDGFQIWLDEGSAPWFTFDSTTMPQGTILAPGAFAVVTAGSSLAGVPAIGPDSLFSDGGATFLDRESGNVVVIDPAAGVFIQTRYNDDVIDPNGSGGFTNFPGGTRVGDLVNFPGASSVDTSYALDPDGATVFQDVDVIRGPVRHSSIDDGNLATQTNGTPGNSNIDSNSRPLVNNTLIELDEDASITINPLAGLVVDPDTDADFTETFIFNVSTAPQFGVLTLNDDGTFTYEADDDTFDQGKPGESADPFLFRIEVYDGRGGNATFDVDVRVNIIDDGVLIVGEADNRNDLVGTDGGEDTIIGGAEEDELYGLDGADIIDGGSDEDILFGGEGRDSLFGGGDDDTLVGGLGDDELTGGQGDDIFVLIPGHGTDTILDFDTTDDKLGLQGFGFDAQGEPLIGTAFTLVQDGDDVELRLGGEVLAIIKDTEVEDFEPREFEEIDTGDGLPDGDARVVIEDYIDEDGNILVEITGLAQQGEELVADVSGLFDPDEEDPGSVEYQWLRNGIPIDEDDGGEEPTYTPGEGDVLAEISVRVDYIRGDETLRIIATSQDVCIAGLPQTLDGTSRADVLTGEAGNDRLSGLAGDDRLTGAEFDDTIDGGDGVDTAVYTGAMQSYTIAFGADGTVVEDRRGQKIDGTDTLTDVELLEFGAREDAPDGTPPETFDLRPFSAAAGISADDLLSLVEVYIAFYGRAPDALGLLFWASALQSGVPLEEIVAFFATAPEAEALFPADVSNAEFVSNSYDNVLGRDADDPGLGFWSALLDAGIITRDVFILRLLEGVDAPAPDGSSPEFVAQKAADRAHLDDKAAIGTSFAVSNGLSDDGDATDVLALYDGTAEGLEAAAERIQELAEEASAPEEGIALYTLVGVLDDPFAAA